MNDIIKRLDINELYQIKLILLKKFNKLYKIENSIDNNYEKIKGYKPFRIEYRFDQYGKDKEEKHIDKYCWQYLVSLYELEKYMLCTDYEKMENQINKYETPIFNIENAQNWIDGLKDLILENIKKLIESVFDRIIKSTYITGGNGWYNGIKKKRNNNGIDNFFIISTYDYDYINTYCRHRPTITDDLEKVCYIISGKILPKLTIKDIMREKKINEYENEYFKIKFCKNGNTHYWLKDEIREKLNYFGSGKGQIGESIKIKILDKK